MLLNVFLIFTKGWVLVIFNVPCVLGAIALFSDDIEDTETNEQAIQMYMVGFIKCAFGFVILYFVSQKANTIIQDALSNDLSEKE